LSIWQAEATLGLHMNGPCPRDLRPEARRLAAGPACDDRASLRRPALSDRTSLQGGLVAGLRGSDALGVSLSLWQEF
jgi:hypothetical protein